MYASFAMQCVDALLHPLPLYVEHASTSPFHFGHYFIPALWALLYPSHLLH